eukprot:2269348-Amphidinium_carterae.1
MGLVLFNCAPTSHLGILRCLGAIAAIPVQGAWLWVLLPTAEQAFQMRPRLMRARFHAPADLSL